jgi:hypothetical protein
MIEAKKLVPSVYYDKSRDFQLISELYAVVFNYLKSNTDTITHNPLSIDSDEQLIDLLSYTLGFKPKHKYNTLQLTTVCSSLMLILKNKGNLTSINYILNALLKTEGIDYGGYFEIDPKDNHSITIYCPKGLSDITLLNDMLDYILPAGMSYNIIRQTKIVSDDAKDYVVSKDTLSTTLAELNETTSVVVGGGQAVKASDTGNGRIDNTVIVTVK